MTDKHLRKLGGAVYSSKKVESDFGLKILQQCGWKEGDGLGKNRQGMKECIQVTKRYESEGLGKSSNKNTNDSWNANTYTSILNKIQIKKSKQISRSRSISSNSSTNNKKISKNSLEKLSCKIKNKNKFKDNEIKCKVVKTKSKIIKKIKLIYLNDSDEN